MQAVSASIVEEQVVYLKGQGGGKSRLVAAVR